MRYNGVIQRKLALLNQQVLRIEDSLRDVPFRSPLRGHRAVS